eukprot:1585100-Ditylum_brightwellii.AAC.1
MERVQRDEEDMHGDGLSGAMSDSEVDEGSHDNQPAEDSGEHLRKKGRSNETHHTKSKPIWEDYKFFALTTTEGFLVNFTPDGSSAAKSGRQEYEVDKTQGKIEVMVIFVTSVIDSFQSTQTARKETLTTHAGQSERETDTEMEKFCVAMDNYFTLPH